MLISPSPEAMARLLRLHREAGDIAEKKSEIIADHNAAYGLEQALIHAMLDCSRQGRVDGHRSAVRRHQLIMRRFRQVLETHHGDALFLPQLCNVFGVSERTLRRCMRHYPFGRSSIISLLSAGLVHAAAAFIASSITRPCAWSTMA
jgi:hypothetical protein